jgi:hypothetical protein
MSDLDVEKWRAMMDSRARAWGVRMGAAPRKPDKVKFWHRIVWPEGQGPTAKSTPPLPKAVRPTDAELRAEMDRLMARTPKGKRKARLAQMQRQVEARALRAEFEALLARQHGQKQ